MHKRIVCSLVSLCFATCPLWAVPPKVAHWRLDDGSGTVVTDAVGQNHGTLVGLDPVAAWISDGQSNGAVRFDNIDGRHIEVPHSDVLDFGDEDFSISMWIRYPLGVDPIGQTDRWIIKGTHSTPGSGSRYEVFLDNDGDVRFAIDNGATGAKSRIQVDSVLFVTGEWVHVVAVRDAAHNQLSIYANGVIVTASGDTGVDSSGDISSGEDLWIGESTDETGTAMMGDIDDVIIFAQALTEDDIATIYTPVQPEDGATDVERDVVLSWAQSASAVAYNVYFGTDIDAVGDADIDSPLLVGPAIDANTFDPGLLEYGQTYYWRVDEIGAPPESAVLEGDVRSFTVEPFARTITSDSITATASSSSNGDSVPEKTVDGSGLDASDQHDTTAANMWMTAINQEAPVWIQYEFDGVYKLYQMWVWNSNNALESLVGLGVKTATIEYSTDGTTWTALANVPEFAQAPGAGGYAHGTTLDFGGVAAKFVRLTITSNWGGMGQYGLSEVRFFFLPVVARQPYPEIGATDVALDPTLSWRAGREADTHQVHFGTDSDAVASGAALIDAVPETSYSVGTLDLGTTYYWKIDEVNDATTPSVWEGPVWNFTTTEHLVVDDFEAYTDETGEEVFSIWVDGYNDTNNGAQVGHDMPPYAEQTIGHGGAQSLPLYYGRGSASHSETTRTFDPVQDWTTAGVTTLTLYVYGAADNGSGQFYVKVNGVEKAATVDFAAESWQEVNVDLASLGVDLQHVTSLGISIEGAVSGLLLVDDIQLRP